MSIVTDKLHALRQRLLTPNHKGGAVLVVYPPELELDFRTGYAEVMSEVQAGGLPLHCLDFRTIVFDTLHKRGLLEKTFRQDVSDKPNERASLRQSLASLLQREVLGQLQAAATAHPNAILFCANTAALYPWVSYSALLESIENAITNPLVLPFPGREDGPALHFLGTKDGYNYRATRI